MPSWSARLLSSASEPSNIRRSPRRQQQGDTTHVHTPQSNSIPDPQRSPVQSASSGTASSQGVPRHGRGISHQFPFILKGVKREERRRPGEVNATAPDLNDAVQGELGQRNPGRRPSRGDHKGYSQSTDTDLTTGHCMTCDSLVRWPKGLKVFRCTICLMINDLKPMVKPCFESGPAPSQVEDSAALPACEKGDLRLAMKCLRPLIIYEAEDILSPGKAQSIIDNCAVSYLRACLDHLTATAETFRSNSPRQSAGDPFPQTGNDDINGAQIQALSHVLKSALTASTPKHILSIPAGPEHGRPSTAQSNGGGVSRTTDVRANFRKTKHEQRSGSQTDPENPSSLHAPPRGLVAPERADVRSSKMKLQPTVPIFQPLEDYIATRFGSLVCLNTSFSIPRPPTALRSLSEGNHRVLNARVTDELDSEQPSISGVDAKTLLLGDFAENGSWWSGGRPQRNRSQRVGHGRSSSRSLKMPAVDWAELECFYELVSQAGCSWESTLEGLLESQTEGGLLLTSTATYIQHQLRDIASELAEARVHVQRALLKATEAILKRPGRPLKSPRDCRFLLVLLANPLLHASSAGGVKGQKLFDTKDLGPGQHSGIIKRIVGLLANLPNECHYYVVVWFSRLSENQLGRLVDLVGSFVTYRLTRQHGQKRSSSHAPTTELIPSFPGLRISSSAQLHAALGVAGPSKNGDGKIKTVVYSEDWQLKAAARVMSLLFSANINRGTRSARFVTFEPSFNLGIAAHRHAQTAGQILPTSDFYNTLLDYSDIIADFETWESRRGQFTFCQYPFFYSIWAKIHILEYDARRQMEVKAREAFFHSIMGRKAISQYLVLKIRRDCLVEDSLRGISENVSSGQEDIKKSLKIEFLGEEGVDAGGLRKEWFLLLVREVFDPHHGVFCRAQPE